MNADLPVWQDEGADAASCAALLRVLADETRLAVVAQLLEGPKCVGDINATLGVEQTLLSHHLRVLRDAGLVVTERDGKRVRYSLSEHVKIKRRGPAINLGCCSIAFN